MIRIDDVHSIKLLARATNLQFIPRIHHAIARYSESDRLMGGVLFTDYWGGSQGMHFAGFARNWASRALIWLSFDYPFRQLGVRKVFGLIPEWNYRSRNVALRLGFKIEYLAKDVFDTGDDANGMYITSMYKSDCRWLDMPTPPIIYAPPDRVNDINNPLASMPAVGMMQ